MTLPERVLRLAKAAVYAHEIGVEKDRDEAIAAILALASSQEPSLDAERDTLRCLEIAFDRWYEAHRVGETSEFRFGRVDGPFKETVASTIARLATRLSQSEGQEPA